MRDTSEYYARMAEILFNRQLNFHIKQLRHHAKPNQYISDLISKILNNTSDTFPSTLNELGIYFSQGSNGFKKDIDIASECFSFAFAQGVTLAGLNLAATITRLDKPDFNFAIGLFSFLEKKMKQGCIDFKNRRNDIYYLGGILFFRTQNHEEARRCFKGVRKYHPYRSSAREYMAKIEQQRDLKLTL